MHSKFHTNYTYTNPPFKHEFVTKILKNIGRRGQMLVEGLFYLILLNLINGSGCMRRLISVKFT